MAFEWLIAGMLQWRKDRGAAVKLVGRAGRPLATIGHRDRPQQLRQQIQQRVQSVLMLQTPNATLVQPLGCAPSLWLQPLAAGSAIPWLRWRG